MFTDYSAEPTGFTSTVTADKTEASSSVQTVNILHNSRETQNINHTSVMTQTMEKEKTAPVIDYEKLASFLKRVTPGILEALDETSDSDVLNGYNPVASRDSAVQVKMLNKFSTIESSSKRKISTLAWSTTGGTLAVAYGIPRHDSWCDHFSEIKFYELKSDDDLLEKENKKLETNACVTCISYHPTKPSILAAGLYNGEVALWNLAEDDSIVPLLVTVHGDAVTSLLWRERTINEPHLLITSSNDGYIFIHKLTTNFMETNLHTKYKVVKEHNPTENTRPRSAGGRREHAAEPGLSITCLDFSSKNSIFIVGTLCGGLYKCSLESSLPIQGDDTLIDPVVDQYDRYEGSVTSLKCSETGNLFVSSGTNMEIRVYNLDQTSTLRIITMEYTVIGLKWFPSGREIISAYGANAAVHFYDISNGTLVNNLKIQTTGETIGCLDCNKKRDTAALADAHGNLEIWKIPKQAIS